MGFQIQSTATSFFLHIQSLISIQRAQGSALPEEQRYDTGRTITCTKHWQKLYYFQFISPISKKKKMGNYGEYHSQVHSIYNFAYVLMPSWSWGCGCIVFNILAHTISNFAHFCFTNERAFFPCCINCIF